MSDALQMLEPDYQVLPDGTVVITITVLGADHDPMAAAAYAFGQVAVMGRETGQKQPEPDPDGGVQGF